MMPIMVPIGTATSTSNGIWQTDWFVYVAVTSTPDAEKHFAGTHVYVIPCGAAAVQVLDEEN
jgi:hypothetical protein